MKENKINTYYDLAAATDKVVEDGWTSHDKIISTGTSNGGLTVAATALLFPDKFGLVIPVSGVVDLLAKDRLDGRFDGWSYEYGSSSDDTAIPYLTAESPVENVSHQGNMHFLIFEGVDDTRVNIAHSLKLTAALLDHGGHPDNVQLSSFKNAGHWLAKMTYQNLIAWRAAVLQWTSVFDQVGWSW